MAKLLPYLLLPLLLLHTPAHAAFEWSAYQDFVGWVISKQAVFHRELANLVRSISHEGSPLLLWSLIATSFLYGIFHAAGPGHGKAVISSYMLASQAPLRQGIGLSFFCAFIQAIMAILLMLVLSQVFSLAGKAMQISRFFEVASFAAVGLIGIWMLVRLSQGKSSCGHDHSKDHEHAHDCAHSVHKHSHACSHDHHSHTCSHDAKGHHEHSSSHACAHNSHNADDEALTARRNIWAMVAAVGIRPCTGAILVLLFSISANIFIWGVISTFAMALGTAITVAALAAISAFIRDAGFSLSRKHQVWRQRVSRIFGFIAAFALIFISCSMIWGYISNAGRAF